MQGRFNLAFKFSKTGYRMKYGFSFAMAAGTLALAACGQAPPATAADDQRVDQAMAKVKTEQDRTDQVEAQKQRTAVELLNRQSSNTTPVFEAPIRPIPSAVPGHYASKEFSPRADQR